MTEMTLGKDFKEEWHIDRRVTIGIIFAILANAGSSIWWAASLNAQVLANQKTIQVHTVQIDAMASNGHVSGERMAKMESAITFQNKTLEKLEKNIDNLVDEMRQSRLGANR